MTSDVTAQVSDVARRVRSRVRPSRGFDHLMTPGSIAGLHLPNRIIMAAMDMNLCHDGELDDRDIGHFVARARGGTALVTTGTCAVAYPVGATTRKQPGLSDDRFLPGLRALADGVHAVGGRVCVQMCHHGKTAAVDTAEGRPLLVPSIPTQKPDMSVLVDTTVEERTELGNAREGKADSYHEATDEDLAWVIEQFAAAAARVKAAGVDAVEVHAGHGYLLSAFLSAGYNTRTDRWGGPVENRARLTCDVIAAVRARVGPGYPVLVKFNGQEFLLDNGITADEAVAASRLFEAAGADAITVSGYSNDPFAGFTLGPLPATVAAYREVTKKIKAAVTVPVVAVGRMLPEVAEQMLTAGECDFVAMGRWLLTDPDLVVKIRSGHRASVRPCINCYVCVERNFFNQTPMCTVNPALRTPDEPEPPRSASPRNVVVIGGGPAGMETARLAARRGHWVTLLERADHLGGTGWFSRLTTPPNGPFLSWLEHELRVERVTVRTGVTATVEGVKALRPDVVVVATGARRERPDVPGANLPHVQTGDDLRQLITGTPSDQAGAEGARSWLMRPAMLVGRLLGVTSQPGVIRAVSRLWMPIGRRVVIIGGGLVGLELAEFLAARRRQVTVLEEGPTLGLPMAMPRRLAAVSAAARHGVKVVRQAKLVEIEPDQVVYGMDGERRTAPADTVVIAGGVRPDTALADQLRAAGLDARLVGDAGEVGYILGAVHSAWQVAREL